MASRRIPPDGQQIDDAGPHQERIGGRLSDNANPVRGAEASGVHPRQKRWVEAGISAAAATATGEAATRETSAKAATAAGRLTWAIEHFVKHLRGINGVGVFQLDVLEVAFRFSRLIATMISPTRARTSGSSLMTVTRSPLAMI